MEKIYITITGTDRYYGRKPFKIGHLVRLVKDTDNEYDAEAIKVILPHIDTIGYVANSVETVCTGTFSAGRLYDKMEDEAYAEILFITPSSVIAQVLPPEDSDDSLFEEVFPDSDLAE